MTRENEVTEFLLCYLPIHNTAARQKLALLAGEVCYKQN